MSLLRVVDVECLEDKPPYEELRSNKWEEVEHVIKECELHYLKYEACIQIFCFVERCKDTKNEIGYRFEKKKIMKVLVVIFTSIIALKGIDISFELVIEKFLKIHKFVKNIGIGVCMYY